tara:strand:- start:763 stop:1908 length:1146 start_codon:yes stop_codon:yes gene_type:complete
MSNPTFSNNLKSHGQIQISKNLNTEKILNALSNENLKKFIENDSDKKEILDSIFNKKELNFPISNHEIFYCNQLKEPLEILNYLVFRFKLYKANLFHTVYDFPPYLLIEPVSACNLRCPMCFQVDKSFTRKPFMGMMKWDLFTKVVDEANEIGVGAITLASRGEPTMHPKYSDMLKYVSNKKNIYELKTNTNATFLDEKICNSIFENNVSTVVISADHYEKKQFETLRKGSDFEKIVKNVEMLFEIRQKNFSDSKTEIRISGIDYYKNLDREKFNNFWSKISDNVSAGYAVERWDTYNNEPSKNINSSCSYLWDRMYVWFDGKCNPCDADYKSYLSYGNVKDSSIAEVWNSQELKDLRSKHLEGKRCQLNPCDRCGLEFGE